MAKPTFFEFDLQADHLCIGERLKKGTYRSCISTIPCSTITEALKQHTCIERILAAGYLIEWTMEREVHAPQDSAVGTAKLPLVTEYLTDVQGKFFVLQSEDIDRPEDILTRLEHINGDWYRICLGALKSKGFGECEVRFNRELDEEDLTIGEGRLRTRIYYDTETLQAFGMQEAGVIKPYFCYLFKATSPTQGHYQLSLKEKSWVRAYQFLLEVKDNG